MAPPYGTSPLDEEKGRVYQDQLRRDLPQRAPADATDAARQRDIRRELDRVDRILEAPPPAPPVRGEPREPSLGPVIGSGGRAQPTPAQIEERLRERPDAAPPPPPPTKPVYDLFGTRIQ